MIGDQGARIYFGTGKVGERIRKNYEKIAAQHYGGSMSAMFREAVNEKWGIDPTTGDMKISGKFPTGSPTASKSQQG